MKTRACIFCGKHLEVRRTTVWTYDHFLGKTVRAPVGPFPDAKARDEILMAHEFGCQRRTIRRDYGCDAPLSIWGVPVPQDPND